jgi:hypothetical protein
MDKTKSKLTRVPSHKKVKSTEIIEESTPDKLQSPDSNIERELLRKKSKNKDFSDDGSAKESDEVQPLSEDMPLTDPNGDNVQVCVRIRPLLRDERDKNETYCWAWSQNSITQTAYPKKRGNQTVVRTTSDVHGAGSASNALTNSYAFDHLYYPDHTNEDIFSSVVQKIVRKAMLGYHGSVFSYGQVL